MTEVEVKLPKQWRHWCKRMGLRPSGPTKHNRTKYAWLYLRGKGFVWRVNCLGHFQRGDTYSDFDRWALCDISEMDYIPYNFASFEASVNALIAAYSKDRND